MAESVNGVKENDVCRAIRNLGHPNGSTYGDIKKQILPSNEATPNQLRSLKIATAKGINSGRITQDKNSLRYRLSNPLENATAVVKGAGCSKPYCSKNIRKGCRRRYACNRRRGNLPYCSKYQVKCCRRRKKNNCAEKKPKKPKCKKKKPKKKACKKKKPKCKPKKPKCKPKKKKKKC
ncbi:hypothetical protein RRG08_040045 [Elysia crispata]|uniref:H15 domain-containing protein n=1 Tax=Elysia crispata TaxID=231223 RepID=A0AAE1CMV8_9GAST|nr:hypothetical protein RRG08_040045 [Elysia crispata]